MTEVLILGFLILNGILIWLIYTRLNSKIENLKDLYFGIKEKTEVLKSGIDNLQDIRKEFQKVYGVEEILKKIDEEVSYLARIFLGRKSGIAGEKAVEEFISLLPQHKIARNVHLGGGIVEFAIKLSNGKYLPVDSKFIGAETLKENSVEVKKDLLKKLRIRIQEVAKYVKDEKSAGMGILTVPEGVYSCLKVELSEELEKNNLLLVPYNFLIPVITMVELLYEKLGMSFSEEDVKSYFSVLKSSFYNMEKNINQLLKEIKSAENLALKLKEELNYLYKNFPGKFS